MNLSHPLAGVAFAASLAAQAAVYAAPAVPPSPTVHWQTDYASAVRTAKRQKKMLLLDFSDPADESSRRF